MLLISDPEPAKRGFCACPDFGATREDYAHGVSSWNESRASPPCLSTSTALTLGPPAGGRGGQAPALPAPLMVRTRRYPSHLGPYVRRFVRRPSCLTR